MIYKDDRSFLLYHTSYLKYDRYNINLSKKLSKEHMHIYKQSITSLKHKDMIKDQEKSNCTILEMV